MSLSINQYNRFEGCYFLENKKIQVPPFKCNDALLITDRDKKLKREIIAGIKNAESSIKLCSFILTDSEIVFHLKQAILKNKVAVFILTQLDDRKINSNFLTAEELSEVHKSNDNIHLGNIRTLFEQGAHIRAAENLHAKFIIYDRKKVLITSANITNLSLNLNTELGLFCDEEKDAERFDILFDLIYQHGTQYEKFISAGRNKQFISLSNKHIKERWFPSTSNTALKFTFDSNEQSIYHEIIRIIKESQKEIVIFTYSVVGLNKLPELIGALRSAIQRGIKVSIFSRAMNYRHDHLAGVSILSKLGCKVHGDAYNHSKGIINEKEGFVFTANIDGNHGLKSGFEIGYNLNPIEYIAVRDFFNYKIKSAPSTLSEKPTISDVLKWYRSYYGSKKTKNPLRESIYIISFRKNKVLEDLLSKFLVYIVYKNDHAIKLEIGGYNFKIISFRGFKIMVDSTATKGSDLKNQKYILPYNELKIESR